MHLVINLDNPELNLIHNIISQLITLNKDS
jgi:hypothetical protein